MFQTLIVIASIVVLSAAILTSTIVSAKNAFHQLVIAKTQTAMNDGTSQFQFWAQKFVAKYGTEADWQAQSAQQAPVFHSMCAADAANCNFYETLQWKVTGASSGVPTPASTAAAPTSIAENMTPAVDEQRISATITTIVSDASGRTLYGGRTEEVTARVFNVAPYVVVTATRDLESASGSRSASEGDSGGFQDNQRGFFENAPDVANPSGYDQTTIQATINCNNTTAFDQSNPESIADEGTQLFDSRFHSGGDLVWAYEMPCEPTYGVPSAPPSASNYQAPAGDVYQIDPTNSNSNWQKGDGDPNSFAR
jgi:hypothetical protein